MKLIFAKCFCCANLSSALSAGNVFLNAGFRFPVHLGIPTGLGFILHKRVRFGRAGQSERKMASIAVLLFVTFFVPLLSQTKFGDSQKTKDVNEKIFTGDPTIDTLGGGLIGVGLGALGASVLGPTIGQVMMTMS